MSNKIYSRCGNQCNLCLIFRPNVEKEDQRVKICGVWDKLGPNKYDPATTICDGCMATSKTDGCEARSCVLEKGLEHCGYCAVYPCDIFPQSRTRVSFIRIWTAEVWFGRKKTIR